MQKANAPTQLTVAFASGSGAGPINTIPNTASPTAGAASWPTGFTSVNMEPIASGGIPPFGADFNGLFNAVSNALIWSQAGYLYPYSSAFSTAMSGYPAGAALGMVSGLGLWINQSDGNTTNPDTSAGANWIELRANAGGSSIALSGASVTPTENQLGAPLLVLTGALTAACKLVLPLRQGAAWKIINATTGSQAVTVGGSTGSTITIAAGSTGAQEVFSDGTNYYTTSFNGAGVYLPINGTAVAATALAANLTIALSGAVSGSAATNGTGTVTISTTLAAVPYGSIGPVPANSLLGNPTGSVAAAAPVTLGAGLQFSSSQLQLAPSNSQVIGWLGYTPVNKAGDTVTGSLGIGGTMTVGSSGASAPGLLTYLSSGLVVIEALSGNSTIASLNTANTAYQVMTLQNAGLTQSSNMAVNGYLTVGGYLSVSGTLGVTGAATFNSTISAAGITSSNGLTVSSGSSSFGAVTASNGLTVNGAVFSATSGAFVGGSPSSFATQGLYLEWNRTNGSGESDFINNEGGGTGGFNWYNSNSAGTAVSLIMSITGAGNLTTYGTSVNFNSTSDERVKTNFVASEPRCIHREWFGEYDRTDISAHGRGMKAQDIAKTMPMYVLEDSVVKVPGTNSPMLTVAHAAAAFEQGIWCGREIDKIEAALNAAGITVQ